jgi:hypothetical protein
VSSIREPPEAIIRHLCLSLFAFELNEGIYDCFVLEIQMEKVLKDKFVQLHEGSYKIHSSGIIKSGVSTTKTVLFQFSFVFIETSKQFCFVFYLNFNISTN